MRLKKHQRMVLPLEDKDWQMCPCSVTLPGQCWSGWPQKPHSQTCSEPCAKLSPQHQPHRAPPQLLHVSFSAALCHEMMKITALGRMEVPNLPMVGAEVPHVKMPPTAAARLDVSFVSTSEQQSQLRGHPERVAQCGSSEQLKRR